jgi:hypothetical protein
MYSLKPLQENLEIIHKPKCMYSMKSYHENGKTQQKAEKVIIKY